MKRNPAVRERFKRLRAELHYAQTMNRVTIRLLQKGFEQAKRLGRELRELQRELQRARRRR